MFNFIGNLFSCKAKSVEDFVEIVKREGCRTIIVKPYSVAGGGGVGTSIGVIADFQYALKFVAITPRGRKVVYREHLFKRFGSDRGFADSRNRYNADVKLFLFGEQKVKELQSKLPDASVNLIGPDGRPMNRVMFFDLHREAMNLGRFRV